MKPATDMTTPDRASADKSTADKGTADKGPADKGPTDIRPGEPWYDLNCSFAKRCLKIPMPGHPRYYDCFQDKQGKYNPCCPKTVGAYVWNGCKVGIDAYVTFANGCGPHGWFRCEAGYMAPMDAGAGGR